MSPDPRAMNSKRNRKRLLLACGLTLFMLAILLVYQQYLAGLLGIIVGGLRILHFWWNDPSRGALEYKEVTMPRAERSSEIQTRITNAYEAYDTKNARQKLSQHWRQYLVLMALAYVVIYYDKRMTFYTFFMMMVTTWMWFQVWLSRRVSR